MTRHTHGYNPDGVMAYFISFRCYGTWLHGDPRGSMDRADHHGYGLPPIMADVRREARDRSLLRHPPVLLTPEMRRLTESVILAVCRHRGWALEALNVRTNHVHAVVRAPSIKPEPVMGAFKSWATRHLREAGLIAPGITLWSRHGSAIWL
ncbi:MAG TPA: transposase [Sumerlaeia bacterium]|nr:transposase [Sumerlaeia bacterium]